MKRLIVLAVVFAFAFAPLASVGAQVLAGGVIIGTATGPTGEALPGVTVQVANSAGTVVGSVLTSETGGFSIGGLTAGTYTVNMVSPSGVVIGTSTTTLTPSAMMATINVSATAAAVEEAAVAATVGSATAQVSRFSTGVVLAGIGAAAGAAGAAALVATGDDASASR